MYKKCLQMLLLLGFFWTPANAMSGAPGGAEPWKDNHGRAAPARVRKAADELWDAVTIEGRAALDAGKGFKGDTCCDSQFGVCRILLALLTCGLSECDRPDLADDAFGQWQQNPSAAHVAIYTQRALNVQTALNNFKEEVNRCVVKPVAYSGDANVCVLGPWIKDGAWQKLDGTLVSGRRDLSGIIPSVLRFVNAQGGWAVGERQAEGTSAPKVVVIVRSGALDSATRAEIVESKRDTAKTPLLSSQH